MIQTSNSILHFSKTKSMSARFRAARQTAGLNRRNVIERGLELALVAEGEAGAVLPPPPVRPTARRPPVPLQAPGNTARAILLPPAATMRRGEHKNYPRSPAFALCPSSSPLHNHQPRTAQHRKQQRDVAAAAARSTLGLRRTAWHSPSQRRSAWDGAKLRACNGGRGPMPKPPARSSPAISAQRFAPNGQNNW